MRFVSTRGASPPVGFSAAIAAGLAPDGGLYVPEVTESQPRFTAQDFDGFDDLPGVAARLLAPFFAGDALATELPAICTEAFAFPAPLRTLATP